MNGIIKKKRERLSDRESGEISPWKRDPVTAPVWVSHIFQLLFSVSVSHQRGTKIKEQKFKRCRILIAAKLYAHAIKNFTVINLPK